MSIVNYTAANIGIERLNPLSNLRTEVKGFSEQCSKTLAKKFQSTESKAFFKNDENCHSRNVF